MSNTNTVPNAEAILKEYYGITASTSHHNFQYLYASIIQAMHEHTRLHLEAMRDEIANPEFVSRSRESIIEIANTYIKNNKL